MLYRGLILGWAVLSLSGSIFAQQGNLRCRTAAVPPIVRLEGLAEQFGDIDLICSGGAPNGAFTGNFNIILNTNVTNRLSSTNTLDVGLLINPGTGYALSQAPAILVGPNNVQFTGVTANLSPTGEIAFRFTNLRGVAGQPNTPTPLPIIALISSNAVFVDNPQVYIASPQPALAGTIVPQLVPCRTGTSLPASPNLANLYTAGTVYTAARVTENYGDAFMKKTPTADTGTRIMVRFTDLPAGTQLLVPDAIAGNDAAQPSVSGVFGGTPTGGQYTPGSNTMLLVRVRDADVNGAGGTLAFTPGAPGSPTVTLSSVSAASVSGTLGYAVYEVVDSNPSIRESAEVVTFLGIPPNPSSLVPAINIQGNLTLAPLSTVDRAATAATPIPRFRQSTPLPDCGIIGDCGANYFPRLLVDAPLLSFDLPERGGFERRYIRVVNQNSGTAFYAVTVDYQNGRDWLRIFPVSGTTPVTLFFDAITTNLTPGTYRANINVDGGLGGQTTLPVTLNVRAAPANPAPSVTATGSAATFSGPLVAGSLATIFGANFGTAAPQVTFDGVAATVLFSNPTQINLLVPDQLGSKSTAQLVITANGVASQPTAVSLVDNSPGIFANGVANQDNSANNTNNPARTGTVIQVYITGLRSSPWFEPVTPVTARLGDRVLPPLYAGAAPGFRGVQQVNVQIPADFTGSTAELRICTGNSTPPDNTGCSPAVSVAVTR